MNKKEKEFSVILNKIEETINDELIIEWLKENINWYVKQSKYYKIIYRLLYISHTILVAFIPVLSLWEEARSIGIPAISATSAVLFGVLNFLKPREKWKRYRKTVEKIKCEILEYYSNILEENKNCNLKSELIRRINKLIIEENNKWELEDICHKKKML